MTKTILVQDIDIRISEIQSEEYFSLTDIAKKFNLENPTSLIMNWLRTKDTIELLGTWEMLYNADFNLIEFDRIKNEAGTNRFTMSVSKWTESTNAKGIHSKSGRYGSGTSAHRDLALLLVEPYFSIVRAERVSAFEKRGSRTRKRTGGLGFEAGTF
jgi:hypothetical protein